MKTVITDEKDVRFLKLVRELDKGYYLRIGDGLSRYDKYNSFEVPHIVILLIDSGESVACASYRTLNKDSVEFKRVYVKRNYRRKGIAFKLIKKLEQDAIENGFRHSYIVTGKNNIPAIRLYEKLDYYQIPNIEGFEDDDVVISMKKDF